MSQLVPALLCSAGRHSVLHGKLLVVSPKEAPRSVHVLKEVHRLTTLDLGLEQVPIPRFVQVLVGLLTIPLASLTYLFAVFELAGPRLQ